MDFQFYVTKNSGYTFDLTQLGYKADETVPVYDIWEKKTVGTATGTLTAKVPSHGVKLYRLGNNVPSGIKMVGCEDTDHQGATADNGYYNLAGQKVTPMVPGMYIHKGKKWVMK